METPDRRRGRQTTVLILSLLFGSLATASACRQDRAARVDASAAAAQASAALATPTVDLGPLIGRVGVKPGGLSYPQSVGPAASLMKILGTVLVRRAGEDRFTAPAPKAQLFGGDQVWSGPHAEATVALADNTLIQMAEDTTISIGNRSLSADPASSVALLYGVARLSISPRARGEGAFLTMAGPVLIGAKGTVFGVAVSAGGLVRVGVEHGEVEVAGPAALDKPTTLQTAEVALVDAAGVVGKPEPFKRDDWGEWRFESEAHDGSEAAARLHANRLVGAESRLDTDYQVLQALGTTASTLTWQAEANAKPKGLAEYKASAIERAAAIEAMYRLSVEIARLTNSALSDAFILTELYKRHPKEIQPQFAEFGQEIAGAILYNKKLQVIADVYLAPLRPAYYAHTARGRARAASLDLPQRGGFAQVKLTEVPASEIAKRVPGGLYVPPLIDSTTRPHPVWQRAPQQGWDERLTLQPVPPRQGSWYLPPTRVEGHLVVGLDAQTSIAPAFAPETPTDPGKAELGFLIPPLPPIGGPDGGL